MKKYFKYVLAIAVVFTAMSCSDDYLDVNRDPNNPLTVPPDLALPVAQTYSAVDLQGNRRLNTFGNLMMANWSQSDGFSWYYDEFNYLVTPDFYNAIWDNCFVLTLKQYNVLSKLEDPNYSNYKAIGDIMKAYHFQILVDTYGDMPYSEALLRGENAAPKYDSAQSIYEDLIVKLDAAIASIKVAPATAETPVNDIMFDGDMTSWIKFANTIKLRVLVRQSGMASRAAYVQTNMNNIMTEGTGFISSDVVVNPGYVNEAGKQSPFYQSYGLTVAGALQNNGEATCATDYILDYMINRNDLRVNYVYLEPGTGHLGVPQGLLNYPADNSFEPNFVSKLGPGVLFSPTQDAPLMILSEALFLQAEAVQRGFMSGSAQALYEAAIDASYAYLGAGSGNFYYTQTGAAFANVNWNESPNKIEAIITQKWLALNSINGHESWVEYNRTGFPTGLPIPLNNTRPNRPVRLAYPSSEITGNTANVPVQPNVFTQKIFWAN